MKKGLRNSGQCVRMEYLRNRFMKEKEVCLSDVHKWIVEERYRKRVNAVRGEELIMTREGMEAGYVAAEELPRVYVSETVGLVLLSVRVEDMEQLEQLRRRVNLFPQTCFRSPALRDAV